LYDGPKTQEINDPQIYESEFNKIEQVLSEKGSMVDLKILSNFKEPQSMPSHEQSIKELRAPAQKKPNSSPEF
jgi:hypothetical protein